LSISNTVQFIYKDCTWAGSLENSTGIKCD